MLSYCIQTADAWAHIDQSGMQRIASYYALRHHSLAQLPVTCHVFVSLHVAMYPMPVALLAQGALQVPLIAVPMQLVMFAVLLVVLGQPALLGASTVAGRFVHVLTVNDGRATDGRWRNTLQQKSTVGC